MRLLGISIGVLVVFGMALFGVRIWGLALPYQRFDHPFLQAEKPLVIVRVANAAEASHLLKAQPQAVLWIDVRKTADDQLLILPEMQSTERLVEKSFAMGTWRGRALSRYALAELRPLFPDAPLLADLMREFPAQRFLLNIVDNEIEIDKAVVETLGPLSPDARVLIHSDVDVILRTIKEKKPMWLYGSSDADLMKLMTFESVGLLPAAPFRGDVLIAPFALHGRPAFNRAVLDEVHRRQKSFFLGPLKTGDEVERARAEKPDGLIFENFELAR